MPSSWCHCGMKRSFWNQLAPLEWPGICHLLSQFLPNSWSWGIHQIFGKRWVLLRLLLWKAFMSVYTVSYLLCRHQRRISSLYNICADCCRMCARRLFVGSLGYVYMCGQQRRDTVWWIRTKSILQRPGKSTHYWCASALPVDPKP